jgi:hypothetical protein
MRNTCIYLTRKCPYDCSYCALKNTKLAGPELVSGQWCTVQNILRDLGVNFNLFLGNETWLLGQDLPKIVNTCGIPYALYTSCKPALFQQWALRHFQPAMFQYGIDNLSCGCDYPRSMAETMKNEGDEYLKAYNAHRAFSATRLLFPDVDCQGTITISKKNIFHVVETINDLSAIGVDVGLNFVHADLDSNYDFFPSPEFLKHYLFSEEGYCDIQNLGEELSKLKNHRVQNMADTIDLCLNSYKSVGSTNTCWHCNGDPYGGPSIDADGSLRCCGYRKGEFTSQMSIFDLTTNEKIKEWKNRVYQDSKKCPGCTWSYPRLFARYRDNEIAGKQVFTNHAQFDSAGGLLRKNEREIQ